MYCIIPTENKTLLRWCPVNSQGANRLQLCTGKDKVYFTLLYGSDWGCQPAVVDTKLTVCALPTATVPYFPLKLASCSQWCTGERKVQPDILYKWASPEWCLFSMDCAFFCLQGQPHACLPVRTCFECSKAEVAIEIHSEIILRKLGA